MEVNVVLSVRYTCQLCDQEISATTSDDLIDHHNAIHPPRTLAQAKVQRKFLMRETAKIDAMLARAQEEAATAEVADEGIPEAVRVREVVGAAAANEFAAKENVVMPPDDCGEGACTPIQLLVQRNDDTDNDVRLPRRHLSFALVLSFLVGDE